MYDVFALPMKRVTKTQYIPSVKSVHRLNTFPQKSSCTLVCFLKTPGPPAELYTKLCGFEQCLFGHHEFVIPDLSAGLSFLKVQYVRLGYRKIISPE